MKKLSLLLSFLILFQGCFSYRTIDYNSIPIEKKQKVEVKGVENLPENGRIVLAMNHPLGGLDAIALVAGLDKHAENLKFIVNDLLLQLGKMNGLFLGVNKFGKNTLSKRDQINELFASDNTVCIFPAGLVSRRKKGLIRDLKWKKTFVTLSRKHNRIIVPLFIKGRLSSFFYGLSNFREFLGIKVNIEMLYLSNELFKLKGSKIELRIGEPFDTKSMDQSVNDIQYTEQIREQLYQLADKK